MLSSVGEKACGHDSQRRRKSLWIVEAFGHSIREGRGGLNSEGGGTGIGSEVFWYILVGA